MTAGWTARRRRTRRTRQMKMQERQRRGTRRKILRLSSGLPHPSPGYTGRRSTAGRRAYPETQRRPSTERAARTQGTRRPWPRTWRSVGPDGHSEAVAGDSCGTACRQRVRIVRFCPFYCLREPWGAVEDGKARREQLRGSRRPSKGSAYKHQASKAPRGQRNRQQGARNHNY